MEKPESNTPPHRIDAAVKAEFLAALRRGERREDAAAALGFSLMGLYGARRRDPAFKAGWIEALAASAAAERLPPPAGEKGELRIACANRRVYQRRWRRNVRFDAARQAIFLAHFAENCDSTAGVSVSTITLHCRTDPAFAEAYAQALAEGYAKLEVEIVRQRLAAQKKLRAAIEAAGPAVPRAPRVEEGAEFDRIMKLLARRDRKPRRHERHFKEGGRRQRMTFDTAMILLRDRLTGLGLWPPARAIGK